MRTFKLGVMGVAICVRIFSHAKGLRADLNDRVAF
jgi:hypothetical protein